jgi:probable phosphoglycerate mutase
LARPVLTLIRHGETEWSRSGQHTSHTDLELTPTGVQQAGQLGAVLAPIRFDLVLSSPRRRARHTAELAGLVPYEVDDDLVEWDYGELEGETTAQIRERYPGWTVWAGPCPGGETLAEVTDRADRVLARILQLAAGGALGSASGAVSGAVSGPLSWPPDSAAGGASGPPDSAAGAASGPPDSAPGGAPGLVQVALVGHGHFSRVLAARWVGQDTRVGEWLDLGTGTWSQLAWYRDVPVLHRWNVPVPAVP